MSLTKTKINKRRTIAIVVGVLLLLILIVYLVTSRHGDDGYADAEGTVTGVDEFDKVDKNWDEPIDIVITWVDNTDAVWREQLQKYKEIHNRSNPNEQIDARTQRYRDNDEIRFCLRSIEKFAPWIRNIFIVTYSEDSYPSWLNINHSKIKIIPHSVIFKNQNHLPTFNSHAIESNLANIPGLSDRFLYSNDDTLFGEPMYMSDFIDENNLVLIGEGNSFSKYENPGSSYGKAWMNLYNLVETPYGLDGYMTKQSHQIQMVDKKILSSIHPYDMERTSASRFRSGSDIPPMGACYQEMIHRGIAKYVKRSELYYERNKLGFKKAKFICVNDGKKYSDSDYFDFFNQYVPVKSRIETFTISKLWLKSSFEL